ncbi:hypothetical protein HK099_005005 [Clydaea vesicula]|uniref:Uncharacterized protein n=1 Tax=Clydaea vesicula TaxID=447962 RepID=A0AAD5XZV4_9FUNG|nr:hypothetical protein HK099_005005 [Clydaea vesicula]
MEVYYTINDYESKDLHLKIKEQQYLCVELSIVYPIAYIENAKNLDIEGLLNSIDLKKDSLPFPVPEGYKKIIFFQGAVPFSSLIEIYQQKVITSNTGIQNKLKQSWGKLNQTSNSSTSGDKLNERVEYIMMRGPHGKGQCQVAIKEVENSANGGASLRNKNSSSWLKGFSTNIINSTSLLFDNNETKSLSLTVDELMCSMTYVNIPWQSIISDLLEK